MFMEPTDHNLTPNCGKENSEQITQTILVNHQFEPKRNPKNVFIPSNIHQDKLKHHFNSEQLKAILKHSEKMWLNLMHILN